MSPSCCVAATPAFGQVTFTKDVAPIVFRSCVQCHRPGGIGTVQPSHLRERAIACDADRARDEESRDAAVESRIRSAHKFIGLDPLTDAEIDIFQRWVADGAREGNRRDLPAVPIPTGGWQLGNPDLVRHDARAVRAGGRRPRRVSRVRAAASGRSSALRAGHRVPREQPARPSCQYPRRSRPPPHDSSTSRIRRPDTTASSCGRPSTRTDIFLDGLQVRRLHCFRKDSRGN